MVIDQATQIGYDGLRYLPEDLPDEEPVAMHTHAALATQAALDAEIAARIAGDA